MDERLKACPFCANWEVKLVADYGDAFHVECPECGCEGPYGDHGEDQAIQAWNMRSADTGGH